MSWLRNAFKSKNQTHSSEEKEETKTHHNGGDSNHEINQYMAIAEKMQKKIIRILLLGPGDSGKTTIVKQLKNIHGKITANDMEIMIPLIRNVVTSWLKMLLEYVINEIPNKNDDYKIDLNLKQLLSDYENAELTDSVLEQIVNLWNNQKTVDAFVNDKVPEMADNIYYFMSRFKVIMKTDYVPNVEDYLRIRARSTGYYSERISKQIPNAGEYIFEFTDVGGQKSERKKWMKVLSDDISAVLFVVAISDYDNKCFEDKDVFRIHDALNLFRDVVEKKFFDNKSVFLFFNKYDLFCKKIQKIPITASFPHFPNDKNPNDAEDVTQFLEEQFLAVLDSKNKDLRNKVHVHLTTALDSNNIEKLFGGITMDLVLQNLQNI